jgi:prevent-host-death family protein
MKTVSVSRLKASLSEYLAHVKAGEEVLVTDRRKPIARIIPVTPADSMPDYIREMERQGLIKVYGTGRLPDDFWDLPRPKDPEGLVLKDLLEDREDRV